MKVADGTKIFEGDHPNQVRDGAKPPVIIIVGGGPAGLSAARQALNAGCSVILVEARDRLGGRAHTVELEGNADDPMVVTVDTGMSPSPCVSV